MRLIDTGALIDVLNSQACADWLSEQEEYTPASIVEHALETLPTVDAVPSCDGCRYEQFGNHRCYSCARNFADRYVRKEE